MMNQHRDSITRLLGVAVAVLAGSASGLAQQPATPAGGTIAGVIYDSLVRNAPLTGAEVTVDGTALSALTDSRGQFRLDGVPPGRVVVRFYHAMLDSLGFGAAPVAVTVGETGITSTRLATPSPTTLRAALCRGPQPASSGVVIGRVRNVDDNTPLAGATVTASWSEWSIGKQGLVHGDRRVTATATTNGSFALCGVPNDVAVVVRASTGGHTTGLAEVDLSQRLFTVRDFAVSLADSGSSAEELARLDSALASGDSVASRGASIIAGVVHASHGRVVAQAQVALLGFPIAVRTGAAGEYALTKVPAGTQTVDVRALGFAPQRLTLDVRTSERRTLDLTLDDAKARELAPVSIVGRAEKFDRTGFDDRHKAGLGQFITEEEIARRGVFDTEQVLWNVLGARVVWDGHENVVRFTRPAGSGRSGGTYTTLCAPAYWVDGIPMARPVPGFPEDVNTFVKPRDIRGIEVYTSPSQAPAQYRRPDVECGVVMIWTKAPRPKQLKQPAR